MEIPDNEVNDLETLLQDIHSELYGAAKYPLDSVTATNLERRTLAAIAKLHERRSLNRQNPPG